MPESFYVQALYAYSGVDTSSLSFRQGEIIEVLSTLPSGWWDGVLCEQKIRGWFPSNYVQRISDEEAGWAKDEMISWWEGAGEAEEDEDDQEQDESSPIGNTSTGNSSEQPSPVLQSSSSRHRTTDSTTSAISRADTQDEEDYWVPKVTYSGQLFYFNTRTAETSRDMPMDGQGDGVVISPDEFASDQVEGEKSIMPTSYGGAGLGPAVDLRRMSVYSDDSALDADFGEGRTTSRRSFGPPQRESASSFPTLQTASTSELFDPPSPPFVIELELAISESLQALISAVGIGGLRLLEKDSETHAASDRESLVVLADTVVDAISTLLQSAGALDSSVDMPSPPPNEITGPFPRPLSLPPFALIELRPFTRRVTSTLSKLVLSIRAVWGLLETIAQDQQVEQHNPIDHPTAEEDALFHKENETKKYEWGLVKESRLAIEAKLRSEVLSGARDVQSHVLSFLGEFERHLASLTVEEGATFDRTSLRMPNATLGALTMTANAMGLPGGGYGGNWRGNGFVTLPSSQTETNLESLMGATAIGGGQRAGLSYAYPSTPLSSAVAKALVAKSAELLDEAESLKSAINSLSSSSSGPVSTSTHSRSVSASSLSSSFTRSRPLSSSSSRRTDLASSQYLGLASRLLGRISAFLSQLEDTDVAASVDVELQKSSMINGTKPVHSLEYIKSVGEARPLLEQLDVAKQQLYDIAPCLLSAVQQSLMASSSRSSESPISGASPLLTSPLALYSPPTRSEIGPETILDVLADLKTAVELLCRTFTALGGIADVQALTPSELRQKSSAPGPIKPSHDHDISSSTIVQSIISHPTSSTSSQQSLGRAFEEEFPSPGQPRIGNRASTDSDFFFPSAQSSSNIALAAASTSPPVTPTSSPTKSRSSKTSAMFSAIGGGWDRRESNATTASGMSDGMPFRKELPFRVDDNASPTRSPSNVKLAKLLGTADPSASPMRSTASLPEAVPAWLGPDYGPDEISFNMEGQVKGGTMRALIIAAASHEGRVDSNYLSTLLTTYRTFCTSHTLLDLLIQRFQVDPPMGLVLEDMKIWETRKLRPIRARVANVIKSWVREHMDHDEFDPDLLRRIADFATTTMRDPVQSPQIIKVVEERLKGAGPRSSGSIAPGPLPTPIVPRGFRKLKFIDIEPLELARQLTIMDGRLFSRITPQECLGKAWPKEYGSGSPNISAMIDMSNGVTRWVTETILAQDDAKKRANTIKHFIAVAERCLALNNFSTLIHIIAGLNSTPIHRLRRTWETLSQKSTISLEMVNKIMRPDKNYKEYREALRGVAPPCVPFLGVYLTDWTFIGDGNPDMLREKPHQINFQKRQKAAELILMIKLHQSTTYNLSPVPVLVKYLEEQLFPADFLDVASDDQRLYEISLMREPREREDEKIARLLSESGFL